MVAGLYVHIPFCLKKCCYCDFVSYPYDEEKARAYCAALVREIGLYGAERLEVASVFFGGGTPTCLPARNLAAVMEEINRFFNLSREIEVTVEANPGTVDPAGLRALRAAGANRLSLGVQAGQDRLLNALGRAHTAAEAVEAVQMARAAGFDNLNIDLIFGVPGQTMNDWRQTLKLVVDFEPEHLAAYNLQIEDGTPLKRAVAQGKVTPCPEDLELAMYREAMEFFAANGFIHYEISNFARPGRESIHNLGYWLNHPYLGVGAGSHSYLGGCRFANLTDLSSYIERLGKGELPVACREAILPATERAETVFLGLRLIQGLDLQAFYQRFGRPVEEIYRNEISRLTKMGLLEYRGRFLRLTPTGLPLANEVFKAFV